MRGKHVIIQDFAGHLLIRRVWEVTESKIYVTDDDGYAEMQAGRRISKIPIGFPVHDVFEYEKSVALKIRQGEPIDRSQLRAIVMPTTS